MQKTPILTLAIVLTICMIPQNIPAEDIQNWNFRHLPDGVRVRIGKGSITGSITSTDNGKRLAVPCSIGIWI